MDQPHWSVNRVNFDQDILCEECRRRKATHYIQDPYASVYYRELCGKCTKQRVIEINQKIEEFQRWESEYK
jgi:hypothetical protein